VAGGFETVIPGLVAFDVENFGGDKEAALDEWGFVGVFEVQHDYFLLFISVLFEDLLL
jgi:hypothetical protein